MDIGMFVRTTAVAALCAVAGGCATADDATMRTGDGAGDAEARESRAAELASGTPLETSGAARTAATGSPTGSVPVATSDAASAAAARSAGTSTRTSSADAAAGRARGQACLECHEPKEEFANQSATQLATSIRAIVAGKVKHKRALKLQDAEIDAVAAFLVSQAK